MHIAFYICLVALCLHQVLSEFGCRNENGDLVDWFMLYKLPKNRSSSNPNEQEGEAYAALDATQGAWVHSQKSVEDENSYMAKTYMQILDGDKNIAYLMYNDQLPESHKGTSYWGHTKGILATDGVSGFWLVHSVPRFPVSPSEGHYDYPENAKVYGQSLLCISINFDQIPVIVKQFLYTKPQVYAFQSNAAVDALPKEIKAFFTHFRRPSIRKPPWNHTSNIYSRGKQTFTLFAKHPRFGKDLYDAMVAPSLKSSLYVQSWQVGAGTPLDADCTDKYVVYNVEEITLNYSPATSSSFAATNDHSKWAVAQAGFPTWVCIGDINRMESQYHRGGLTVCINSQQAWKAYSKTITDFEGCPIASHA